MQSTFLIAEIAQAHEGSLCLALSYCEEVKRVGFDAIKFQMHIASEESTYDEKFRVQFSDQDLTRYDYWERTSFSYEQWRIIVDKCNDLGLSIGISPFSVKAVENCRQLGVDFLKIGSGEVFNSEIINELNSSDRVFISSGMSTIDDSLDLVKTLRTRVKSLQLMHCHSSYPMPIDASNLSAIPYLRDILNIPIGFSDHSGNLYVSMSSIAHGASSLEVHAVFSKRMFGPDTSSSLDFGELARLVEFRNIYMTSYGSPDKIQDRYADPAIRKMRNLFGRSIALKQSRPKGYVIKHEDLCFKKPSTGFQASDIDLIVGKQLTSDYSHMYLLKPSDISEVVN